MVSIARIDILVVQQFLRTLREWIPDTEYRQIHVAYSGGLDSTVLLHCLHSVSNEIGQISVNAIHVHHQLNPGADEWVQHCKAFCHSLNIPLVVKRVTVLETNILGIEAAARKARYMAFQEEIEEHDLLLTAHHQDDQGETLLLQLMRGSGVNGLAAMPAKKRFGQGWLGRPFLKLRRNQLHEYAMIHRLNWIEDDSNQDIALSRNYIRHQIMPRLEQRWPAASATIARSAKLCAEQVDLLESLIQEDLSQRIDQDAGCLNLLGLLEKEKIGHLKALLRQFFKVLGLSMPNFEKMQEFCQQLIVAGPDRMPEMTWDGYCIKRYGTSIYLVSNGKSESNEPILFTAGETSVGLGSNGRLECKQVQGEGLSLSSIKGRTLLVRYRKGGERIRLSGRTCSTSVKKFFQEQHVPPWERHCIPLIYADEDLIMLPGMGIHQNYYTREGPCLDIIWVRPSVIKNQSI